MCLRDSPSGQLIFQLHLMQLKLVVNQVMSEKFRLPYPARSLVGVDSLPKGASIEMDAIAHLGNQ